MKYSIRDNMGDINIMVVETQNIASAFSVMVIRHGRDAKYCVSTGNGVLWATGMGDE
jgi:hypothetical protein